MWWWRCHHINRERSIFIHRIRAHVGYKDRSSSPWSADMPSPTPVVECFRLGPLVSSRIWTGLWQLSSQEWGTAKVSKVLEAMKRHVEMGYNGFGTQSHHNTYQCLTVGCVQIWCVRKFDLNLSANPFSAHSNLVSRVSFAPLNLHILNCSPSTADHYGSSEILFVST